MLLYCAVRQMDEAAAALVCSHAASPGVRHGPVASGALCSPGASTHPANHLLQGFIGAPTRPIPPELGLSGCVHLETRTWREELFLFRPHYCPLFYVTLLQEFLLAHWRLSNLVKEPGKNPSRKLEAGKEKSDVWQVDKNPQTAGSQTHLWGVPLTAVETLRLYVNRPALLQLPSLHRTKKQKEEEFHL